MLYLSWWDWGPWKNCPPTESLLQYVDLFPGLGAAFEPSGDQVGFYLGGVQKKLIRDKESRSAWTKMDYDGSTAAALQLLYNYELIY